MHRGCNIKCSSVGHEHRRRDTINGNASLSREHPFDVIEANRQTETCKTLLSFRKRNENGCQHLLGGDGENTLEYLRYGRKRPEFRCAQNYKHEKKVDSSAVRNQEVIDVKFKGLKEAVCKYNEGGVVGGSNHAM